MIDIMPDSSAKLRPPGRNLVVIAYERLALFEFASAVEVFGQNRPEVGPVWYRCSVAAVDAEPLRATGGVGILADGGPELLDGADTIIVPGWSPGRRGHPIGPRLAAAYRRGARIVSICTGAFLLADAGLLDGLRATTHWCYIDRLEAEYPQLEVVRDVLYVDEGRVMTSAGSAAGIDLCLHVVRSDFGATIANMVARRLVVAAHREGGQRQFVDRPVPRDYEAGRLSGLMDALRREIAAPASVGAMAARAGMSRRTFIRRFKEATGMPPAEWLWRERTARARELLETSGAPVEEVARLSGFGSPAALRHHFGRHVGITPTLYRRRFATAPELQRRT